MLVSVNVNGTLSELSVTPEAISWRRAPANGSHKCTSGFAGGSPVKQLVRRLSNSSLNIATGGEAISTTPNAKGDKDERRTGAGNEGEVHFNQVIGLTRVRASKSKCDNKGHQHDTSKSDRNVECSADKSSAASCSTSRLKLYYARRNDKNHSGRLLKLKKIVLELNSEFQHQHHLRHQHDNSPKKTGTNNDKNPRDLLDDLHELLEQRIELRRRQRPKRLLVFVNPFGGKGRAVHLYEKKVKRIFELAHIESQLVVTKYANHAREMLEDPQFNVDFFDGIICVGGDGMFAELMNGLIFRFNRDKLLARELRQLSERQKLPGGSDLDSLGASSISMASDEMQSNSNNNDLGEGIDIKARPNGERVPQTDSKRQQLTFLRSALGGIGERFESPSIPIGVIGAGSTDANLFGFIGTNDVISATLNIVLGYQIEIDIGSVHSLEDDKLLRFVSTFVAYGYFGDVVRESEKLRWLGPSRYDVTALNSLIRYRNYEGSVRILRSPADGTPHDLGRCHLDCSVCANSVTSSLSFSDFSQLGRQNGCASLGDLNGQPDENGFGFGRANSGEAPTSARWRTRRAHSREFKDDDLEIIETSGAFIGVNAAVTACRCPQTKKGFSPSNHLANGCADLILVRPCTRLQYVKYLIRTGFTRKSAFDLNYVEAYRCRQFEFIARREADCLQPPGRSGARPADGQTGPQLGGAGADENDNSTTSGYASSTTTGTTLKHSQSTTFTNSHASGPQLSSSSAASTTSDSLSSRQLSLVAAEDGRQQQRQQSKGSKPQRRAERKQQQLFEKSAGLPLSSSWNADGEILHQQSIRVKVNQKLLRVFGTGEPRLMTASQ